MRSWPGIVKQIFTSTTDMKKLYLTCFCWLISSFIAIAQHRVSEVQAEVMQMQVKELIANYYASLTSIGDKDLEFSDRELILANTLKTFESKNVLVFNDLDPSRTESSSLKAEVYLGNIITKYAKGLSFETGVIFVSEVFYDQGMKRNFLKAEVTRSMNGIHIDRKISRTDTIDIYVAFIENASAGSIGRPVIYAVEPHKDNLHTFKAAQSGQQTENKRKANGWKSIASSFRKKTGSDLPTKPLAFTKSPAGKKYTTGSTIKLSWTSTVNTPVKGDLYRGDQLIRTLFSEAGQKQYKWKIPESLPAGDNYALKLTNLQDESYTDLSGRFQIRQRSKYRKWIYVGMGAVALTTAYLLYNANANQGGELPGFPDPP